MAILKTVARDVVAVVVVTALAIIVEHYFSVGAAIAIVLCGCLLLIWLHDLHKPIRQTLQQSSDRFILRTKGNPIMSFMLVISVGALLGGGLFAAALFYAINKPTPTASSQSQTAEATKPPTLISLFNSDFPNTMKLTEADAIGIKFDEDGSELHITRQLYLDFPAKTQFVGFYVPSSLPSITRSFAACLKLVQGVRDALDDMPKRVFVGAAFPEKMNTIHDLTFSGRVLLYHEDFLSIPQKAEIIKIYKAKNLDVQFRGPDYLGTELIAWHHKHDPPPKQQ